MAVSTQRTLPAQFIEDLGKDYGTQLKGLTSIPLDTDKFAPKVAPQDAAQQQAYTLGANLSVTKGIDVKPLSCVP